MNTYKRFSIKNRPASAHARFLAGVIACLLGVALVAPASQAAQRTLQSLQYSKLAGNAVAFTLRLSQKAPKPLVFTVQKPASISIDIPNTKSVVNKRLHEVNVGNVRSAVVVEGKTRTRVVINLTELSGYHVETNGDKIRISVNGKSGGSAEQLASSSSQHESASSAGTQAKSIKDVNFHRGEHGSGQVVVQLSQSDIPISVSRKGDQVVAKFPNTDLPKKLHENLSVLDFATPAKSVRVEPEGSGAQVVVTPRSGVDYKQVAYQTGNKFTLELQPVTAKEKSGGANANKPQYTGKKISLNFQKVNLRALLQIIADVADKNIVVSDQVHGTMSLRLHNVPWDQALHIILSSNALGKREHDNVIMVAPLKTLATLDAAKAKIQAQHVNLSPLHSALIQVNYAKAQEVADLIKSEGNSLLSKRGEVSVDARTNTLLVQDTPEKIQEIRRLLGKLDKPVKQVSISTRIVVASNSFDRDVGTRFGITASTSTNHGHGAISTTGSGAGNDTVINGYRNGSSPVPLPSLANRYNFNAPATSPAGQIGLAILNSNFLVDLELSAKQAEGKMEVVSTPRVITTDSKEASIERGIEIPYQEAASSGATSISFKKAILQLKVTPQITPDGRIIMDLAIRDDSKGDNVSVGTGGQEPAINTRRINTRVLVNNGDTVVLGGIYEHTTGHNVTKIPLLGDIPLLGFLFRNTEKINNKKQILVFVTPRILNNKVKTNGI